MKAVEEWMSPHVEQAVRLVRWGLVGTPVLLFPTAGGDAEECERFGLIDSLSGLLGSGRVKIYSTDSIAGRSWLRGEDPRHVAWLHSAYDRMIVEELLPAIWTDCRDESLEVVTTGASIGAFWALEVMCRHPEFFRVAVCMSGTFDLSARLEGYWDDDLHFSSPLHFVPDLDAGAQLARLRTRFAVLAAGGGRWEDASQSARMADLLGAKGVPNRFDQWSDQHDHDWTTWREMLPLYLDDLA